MKLNKKSPVYVVSFIIGISIFFGFGVAFVHYSTAEIMKKNEMLRRNKIIAAAFELDVKSKKASAYEEAISENIKHIKIETDEKKRNVYEDKRNGNIGFIFSGTGFWDKITGILVLTPDLDEIVNIKFLEQKETPGLGARIEEKEFTNRFKGLQIAWNKPVDERIIIGPSAESDAKNRVDAITGATQTSIALMGMINSELKEFKRFYKDQ